jgi:hypothetical protein
MSSCPYYARDAARAAAAKLRVSPAPVVFEAVSAPCHCRRGEPAESHTSTPVVVMAGIEVNEIVPELEQEPVAADPIVMVCEAYEPPVTSVPAEVFDPLADMSRSFSGPVGAV